MLRSFRQYTYWLGQAGVDTMNHEHQEWLNAVTESIHFFSSANKGAIDRWACTEFLKNIGIDFQPDEVVPQTDDPPDVIFRNALFEVKEILDCGRRRHDEYKDALANAQAAKTEADLHAALAKTVTPEDITPLEIGNLISAELTELVSKKYVDAEFRGTLNLLFYVDLTRQTLKPGPMPDPAQFSMFGFRSISVLMGWGALVYCAALNAPDFLLAKVGTVTLRRFG